jgi:hypothetical protein
MKNPLSKLAVAAAFVVVGIAAVSMWTGTQPSVALADVLTRIEEVRAYVYRSSSTITGMRAGGTTVDSESHSVTTTSADYGTKTVSESVISALDEKTVQEMYISPQTGTALTIMPQLKRYLRIEYDEGMAQRMREQDMGPSAIVELAMGQGYESLGRSTIDGVEVEGFRSMNDKVMSAIADQSNVTIYVDVRTQLPVRMEIDAQTEEGVHTHTAMYDFQWNVMVDAAEFNPVIPDDYTPIAGGAAIRLPAMDEGTALEGLGLYLELTGRYPEKLDMMNLLQSITDPESGEGSLFTRLQQMNQDRPEEERIMAMVEVMMPIQAIGTFYALLVAEDKDPAYYGQYVTPVETDQVLMRWKVSDNEYRVIFGNLQVENVTADVLAELEASLPQ